MTEAPPFTKAQIAQIARMALGEKINHIDYARRAIASFGPHNLIHHQGGSFWAWTGSGVWVEQPEYLIRKAIHRVMPEDELTASKVDGVFKLMKAEAFADVPLGQPFPGINTPAGELHFEDGAWVLKEHVKGRWLITQIPVAYDETAAAPRFAVFLDEIFRGDGDKEHKKQLLLEMIGYTLLSTARFEAFIILIGSGGNGKSVLLYVLECLCGKQNVSAVQPENLGSTFQRAYLHGKLANVVTEVAEGAVVNDAALKAITSGDMMTAERKFRDPFSFEPFATCWIGTNHMPHTRDFSDALFRRAKILTFNRKFEGDDRDPLLKQKLVEELPGILNMALKAVAGVLTTGKFAEPSSMVDAVGAWAIEADTVKQFVIECCELCHEVPMKTLYGTYQAWCRDVGINKPLKQRTFSNRLRLSGISDRKSGSVRYYVGISIA